MKDPLQGWYRKHVLRRYDSSELATAFDIAARNSILISKRMHLGVVDLYKNVGDRIFFDYLDFIVYVSLSKDETYGQFRNPEAAEDLEEVLLVCGSEWRVGFREGLHGLESRVSAGLQEAVDAVVSQGSSAGDLLAESWHSAFGKSPDAEDAYEKAIKAVEAAAIPVVEPNNKSGTLGTVISVIRNQKDWSLELVDKKGGPFPRSDTWDDRSSMERSTQSPWS